MKKCIAICLLAFASLAHAQDWIFLIEGQSNASGRGALTDVPVYANNARIFQYGNDNVYKQAVEPVDSITGQIDTVSIESTQAGSGIGLPFADRLLSTCGAFASTDTITLVPAAVGGASVAQWRQLWDRAHLYGSAVQRMYEAKAITGGKFAGILHWQGETEGQSTTLADTWSEKTSNNISNLRHDLAADQLPVALFSLNTVYPNTSPYVAYQYLRSNYMSKFAMHNLAVISTDVTGHIAANVHYVTSEYVTIGIRAADAMCPML
jgi:hypothetical protein